MVRVIGLGAGGHAKVVIEILRQIGDWDIIGLLDTKETLWNTEVSGVPVLGDDALLSKLYDEGICHAFIGLGTVGDTRKRQRIYEELSRKGLVAIQVIHPKAIMASSLELGNGLTIMANAVVNSGGRLGDNVLINSGAIVEHDCIVNSHSHIASGATLCSTIEVGEGAHIGAGATVKQCIKIGNRAVVGAGAVVICDVPPETVVVGVPARPITGSGIREVWGDG